jgi:hypothetical protein
VSFGLQLNLPMLDALNINVPSRAACRYWLGSCDLLQADSTALQASSHLAASAACRMLLAAPRLARVPSCFFRVLMQYTLFLVPQWWQQVRSRTRQ